MLRSCPGEGTAQAAKTVNERFNSRAADDRGLRYLIKQGSCRCPLFVCLVDRLPGSRRP